MWAVILISFPHRRRNVHRPRGAQAAGGRPPTRRCRWRRRDKGREPEPGAAGRAELSGSAASWEARGDREEAGPEACGETAQEKSAARGSVPRAPTPGFGGGG